VAVIAANGAAAAAAKAAATTIYLPSFFGRGDDPFGSLFREVQKTFEDFSQRTPFARFSSDTLSPKIDIAESKDAIDVTAELPGVDEKDLDVTLANGMLTIRREKKTERDEQDWHVVERSYGAFSRAIPLPFDPDPAKVEAKFDKGVLHIHLPKPAEAAEAAKDRDQKRLRNGFCCAADDVRRGLPDAFDRSKLRARIVNPAGRNQGRRARRAPVTRLRKLLPLGSAVLTENRTVCRGNGKLQESLQHGQRLS
jgi:HSP20 family protein